MTLLAEFLEYPWRRHGMDHDLYPFSTLFERKPVAWPESARVARRVVPALEFFPLNQAGKGRGRGTRPTAHRTRRRRVIDGLACVNGVATHGDGIMLKSPCSHTARAIWINDR